MVNAFQQVHQRGWRRVRRGSSPSGINPGSPPTPSISTMSDVTCPECSNVLRPRPAVLIRLPGKAPVTYLDYDCDQPDCAGSLRIYVAQQMRCESAPDAARGPNPAA